MRLKGRAHQAPIPTPVTYALGIRGRMNAHKAAARLIAVGIFYTLSEASSGAFLLWARNNVSTSPAGSGRPK